jgi:ABC-2 type transport system permease protein
MVGATMLRGLLRLTWIEIKVFMREPLGAIGSIVMPVLLYVVFTRLGVGMGDPRRMAASNFFRVTLPVIVAIFIAINAVLSLIAIVSIYREGGILKRLRATPLRPWTILTAHVLVKLLLTTVTLSLMLLVGRRYFPAGVRIPVVSFAVALVITTWSILSIGFLIASLVPTARFAQPVGAIVLYPMMVLSGLFIPREILPPWLSHLPLSYAVSLLQGIWKGDAWSAHVGDVAALALVFAVCMALSAKLFRWE